MPITIKKKFGWLNVLKKYGGDLFRFLFSGLILGCLLFVIINNINCETEKNRRSACHYVQKNITIESSSPESDTHHFFPANAAATYISSGIPISWATILCTILLYPPVWRVFKKSWFKLEKAMYAEIHSGFLVAILYTVRSFYSE